MNNSYYQDDVTAAGNTGSNYQANASGAAVGNGSANMNGYQNQPATSTTNDAAGRDALANKQGQSTGAEGNGPDFICRILDKLEKKFGGERFNNPDNDAKNRAMNQKMSARVKTIGPVALKKLPQILSMIARKFM